MSDVRVSVQRPGRKDLPPGRRPNEKRVKPAETRQSLADVPANVSAPTPPDPLLVEARIRSQREAARAPLIPQVAKAPRPMPPRTGKPLWRRPHSS